MSYGFSPEDTIPLSVLTGGFMSAKPTPVQAKMIECYNALGPMTQSMVRRQAVKGVVTGQDLLSAKQNSIGEADKDSDDSGSVEYASLDDDDDLRGDKDLS